MSEIKIIYIISPPYSGSTLLSRLLHAHSQMSSVGEHRVLNGKIPRNEILEQRQCTCGVASLRQCSFWQAIDIELNNKHQLSLEKLNLAAKNEVEFKLHNHAFFEALRQVSGKNIIIDSSKNQERFIRLEKAGFTITPIRLQREVLGVINSGIKYGKPWFKTGVQYWFYYQNFYEVTKINIIHINYEQLAEHPRQALQALMSQLGFNFEESQMAWATVPTHYIGGNPMRYQKENNIKLDQKWKKELSWPKRIFAWGLMLLCRLPESWQFSLFTWSLSVKHFFKRSWQMTLTSFIAKNR